MIFGYLVAIAALLGLLWLVLGIRKIGAVSRGEPIGARDKEALLLIDLQTVFWDRGPYSNGAKQLAEVAILQEVDTAKAKGNRVIAIRQEWSILSTKVIARLTMKGQAIEGTAGIEMAQPFAGRADEVLVKRVQDAFETGELDVLLAKTGVGKLRIAGLDMNYCVQKTALAARNRGYEVTVVRDATLSAQGTEHAEEQMVAHGVTLN
jgi:nicotinamidase/pyrazinamidase